MASGTAQRSRWPGPGRTSNSQAPTSRQNCRVSPANYAAQVKLTRVFAFGRRCAILSLVLTAPNARRWMAVFPADTTTLGLPTVRVRRALYFLKATDVETVRSMRL